VRFIHGVLVEDGVLYSEFQLFDQSWIRGTTPSVNLALSAKISRLTYPTRTMRLVTCFELNRNTRNGSVNAIKLHQLDNWGQLFISTTHN
jgi:hypothetical protein